MHLLGVWGIGLATPNTQLDNVPLGMDNNSWVLHSDGCIYHSGAKVAKIKDCPVEGDVIVRNIINMLIKPRTPACGRCAWFLIIIFVRKCMHVCTPSRP